MKTKIAFLFIIIAVIAKSQSLDSLITVSKCGLNYFQKSILLGKRFSDEGLNFAGNSQPVELTISELPDNYEIEKVYIWWHIVRYDSVSTIIIKNQAGDSIQISGSKVYTENNNCSGKSTLYRAEVSNFVNTNGKYYLSNLPTDSLNINSDTDGATLLVIYTDTNSSEFGQLIIYDGLINVMYSDFYSCFDYPEIEKNNIKVKAFMLFTDGDEAQKISLNGSAYQYYTPEFWNFEERNTALLAGQSQTCFGIQSNADCISVLMTGLFYQDSTTVLSPELYRENDTLYCSEAETYQWLLNGATITGATEQSFYPYFSGNYSVYAFNEMGCSFKTDEIYINGIEKISSENAFFLFPNPSDGNTFIHLINPLARILSVEIINQYGINSLASISDNNQIENELQTKNLTSGIYFIKVKTENAVLIRKFVKN